MRYAAYRTSSPIRLLPTIHLPFLLSVWTVPVLCIQSISPFHRFLFLFFALTNQPLRWAMVSRPPQLLPPPPPPRRPRKSASDSNGQKHWRNGAFDFKKRARSSCRFYLTCRELQQSNDKTTEQNIIIYHPCVLKILSLSCPIPPNNSWCLHIIASVACMGCRYSKTRGKSAISK